MRECVHSCSITHIEQPNIINRYVVASGRFEVYLELSPEESRLEVIRQRKKRENGAGDVLKRIVRKRKGNSDRNEDSSGMKNSSVLKRILGHVDLTKFRWYEYIFFVRA